MVMKMCSDLAYWWCIHLINHDILLSPIWKLLIIKSIGIGMGIDIGDSGPVLLGIESKPNFDVSPPLLSCSASRLYLKAHGRCLLHFSSRPRCPLKKEEREDFSSGAHNSAAAEHRRNTGSVSHPLMWLLLVGCAIITFLSGVSLFPINYLILNHKLFPF